MRLKCDYVLLKDLGFITFTRLAIILLYWNQGLCDSGPWAGGWLVAMRKARVRLSLLGLYTLCEAHCWCLPS